MPKCLEIGLFRAAVAAATRALARAGTTDEGPGEGMPGLNLGAISACGPAGDTDFTSTSGADGRRHDIHCTAALGVPVSLLCAGNEINALVGQRKATLRA